MSKPPVVHEDDDTEDNPIRLADRVYGPPVGVRRMDDETEDVLRNIRTGFLPDFGGQE